LVQLPEQLLESAQSKLQRLPEHAALHCALSRHLMLQGPVVHVRLHLLVMSQRTVQGPVVQTKLHVSLFVQVHEAPHSFGGAPLSTLVPPDDEVDVAASVVVVLEPLLLVPLPPLELELEPELDDELGGPLPIVQS
jgi:hypothetical protein